MDPIIIIGAGLLAYLLWSQSQGASGGLPADAVYQGTVPVGTAIAVPQSVAINPTGGAATTPVAGPATTAIVYVYLGPAENMEYFSYTAPTAAQTAAAAAVDNGANPTAVANAQAAAAAKAATASAASGAAPATGTVFPTCGPNNTPPCTCPAGYIFQNTFNVAGAAPGVTTPTCVPGVSGLRGLSGSIRSPYWT